MRSTCEDTPVQLNLVPRLEKKKSQRETPAIMKAPPLAPVVVEPLRCSVASSSLSFLSHINHIEIQDTVERDGVTYYVLEVYLFHYNSRLPTTVNNPRMAAAHDSETQVPDFRVERRYSDFFSLRHQVKFDELVKLVERARKTMPSLPTFFLRTMVALEDFLAEKVKNRAGQKKMSKENSNALIRMKGKRSRSSSNRCEKILTSFA
ncbi:hypothetical protein PsorP6_010359 [Peronosclerospora sorghi]|uniref:Uncharacterized protein n=1 Tax=Peronosclerospora sorghi TaxID=230839 RepID=A0ACC0VYE3_9STRA|nr:hypothetical protein PsorP6_010359 [Peronosclerospora sorghi]